jgi:hypothetical protein
MNLYAIHPDPESAPHHDWDYENVPELVWAKYWNTPEELVKRAPAFASSPQLAYQYACHVLRGPFPAGEPAIAGDARLRYQYARHVLGLREKAAMRWPSQKYAYWYAARRTVAWNPVVHPHYWPGPVFTYAMAIYDIRPL